MSRSPACILRSLSLVLVFLAAGIAHAAAPQPAGIVQFAAGDVKIRSASGELRPAVKGAAIAEGETLLTATSASAQLKMSDGGILAVRPDTELKIDTYRYAGKEDGTERAVMGLAKGGFRTITGVIGRTNKQNYTVATPTAVIGIRGTDHEPIYIPAVAAGSGQPPAPPGTYDRVNVGQAYIRTPVGEVNIRPNQVGYAAPGQVPTLLPRVPEFFKATPPVRQSAAPAQKDGEQRTTAAGSGSTTTTTTTTATTTAGGTDGAPVADSTLETADSRTMTATASDTGTATASTAASAATTTTPSTTTTATTASAPTVTQTVTGTSSDRSAQTVNLTQQTVTAAGGETITLGAAQSIVSNDRTTVIAAYAYQTTFARNLNAAYEARTLLNPVTDANGNLTSIVNDDTDSSSTTPRRLTVSGGTPEPSTATRANSHATTGITFGWRSASAALSVSGVDHDGSFSGRAVLPDGLTWLKGPSPSPFYLPGVLTGTATYVFDGGTTPRDQHGAAGTLNAASLSVNFTRQSATLGLDVSTPGSRWVASATDVKLSDNGEFFAATTSDTTTPANIDSHRRLVLTRNGSSATTVGNVEGRLLASALTGAGLAYTFQDSGSTQRATGAVAFVGAAQSTTPSYHLLGATLGMTSLGTSFSDENTVIVGGYLSGTRTQFAGGYPVAFDGEYRFASVPANCGTCTTSMQSIPATYAVTGASGLASIGTATITDAGTDATSGLSWGRYGGVSGATIGITDRISAGSLGTVNASQQSMHFITSAVQNQPLALPVSGTASYTLVGHTNPTDNLGNVGTLGAAALTANFTAKTVDAAVNLTVAGSAWSAKATGVAIIDGTFEAKRALSGSGPLAVTRNGSTANTAGVLVGAFTGATGQGAAMLYSLNQGGNSTAGGTTVSGVAAFRR